MQSMTTATHYRTGVLRAPIPQERLAPERGVVLQQIVNVPHPVILFAWPHPFLWSSFLTVRDG